MRSYSANAELQNATNLHKNWSLIIRDLYIWLWFLCRNKFAEWGVILQITELKIQWNLKFCRIFFKCRISWIITSYSDRKVSILPLQNNTNCITFVRNRLVIVGHVRWNTSWHSQDTRVSINWSKQPSRGYVCKGLFARCKI